ncbi:MAG: hypothetical protein WBQ08_20245 [Candidatus Sulfotelmatobacter sp.]
MKRLLLILFLAIPVLATVFSATVISTMPAWGQAAAEGTASASQSAPASTAASTPASGVPLDQENARQAKDLLNQAIQALGGQAYLSLHDREMQGRGYNFYHGRTTSTGVLFWSFFEFPDKERDELSKERDVAELYVGNKGYEITYKGIHAIDEKDLSPILRRRKFSLDNVLRVWVNDPKVALFYEGNAIAAEKPALKVTLINGQDEAVSLYVDADTHLPLKKTFNWRDPVDRQKNLEEEIYDNYRPVQGIMTPYSLTRYFNGDMAGQRFLSGASYNQNLDQAMFDPHSGYNPNKVPNKPSGKH